MRSVRWPLAACVLSSTVSATPLAGGDLFRGRCNAEFPPLLPTTLLPKLQGEEALRSTKPLHPIIIKDDPNIPFLRELMGARLPALVRNSFVHLWAARNWTWHDVEETLSGVEGGILKFVLRSESHLYLLPDNRSKLHPLLPFDQPNRQGPMRVRAFFDMIRDAQDEHDLASFFNASDPLETLAWWRESGRHLVLFEKVPPKMYDHFEPQENLYATHEDASHKEQFIWISTPASRTHTHFDSDHNTFVQLLGRKRFVLWAPNQTRHLCPFPRTHPLWHKSRVNFEAPDTSSAPCAHYGESEALTADVEAGDVLYVPPFWWHTVETLSPSLSLSTLSSFRSLYIHMEAVYGMMHFFDSLFWYDARVFALRAFLFRLLAKMLVPPRTDPRAEIRAFFDRIMLRYEGFRHVFHSELEEDASAQCVLDERRGTPTCRHCLARTNFDVTLVSNHFAGLPDDVRMTLLEDYVEEVSAQTVGINLVYSFWEQCFNYQRFFHTKLGTEEHTRLWTDGKSAYHVISVDDMDDEDDLELDVESVEL